MAIVEPDAEMVEKHRVIGQSTPVHEQVCLYCPCCDHFILQGTSIKGKGIYRGACSSKRVHTSSPFSHNLGCEFRNELTSILQYMY